MNWKKYAPYFFIAIVSFLLYGQSLPFDYNLDDDLVTQNHKFTSKGIAGIPDILSNYYIDNGEGFQYGYRPVTQISFALEHQFFGESPLISRLINIFIYIAILWLIFFLLFRLLAIGDEYLVGFITLLFAVHTLHVEAVVSIKNREELLAFFFGILAITVSIRLFHSRKWLFLPLVLALNFLAIYSKQSVVSLMLVAPLLLHIYLRPKLLWLLSFISIFFIPAFFVFRNTPQSYLMLLGLGAIVAFHLVLWSAQHFKLYDRLNKDKKKTLVLYGAYFLLLMLLVFTSSLEVIVLGTLLISLVLLIHHKSLGHHPILVLMPLLLLMFYRKLHFAPYVLWLIAYPLILGNKKNLHLIVNTIILAAAFVLGAFWDFYPIHLLFFYAVYLVQSLWPKLKVLRIALLVPLLIFLGVISYNSLFFEGIIWMPIVVLFIWDNMKEIALTKRKLLIYALTALVCGLVFSQSLLSEDMIANARSESHTIEYLSSKDDNFKRPIAFVENPILYYQTLEDANGLVTASALFYLEKLILPINLSVYYGYDTIQPHYGWLLPFGCIFLFLLLFRLAYTEKNRAVLLWASVYFIVHLLSISNKVQALAGVVADRLAFPLVLYLALVIGLIIQKYLHPHQWMKYVVFTLVLLYFGVFTVLRIPNWKSKSILYSHDQQIHPNSAKLNSILATNYVLSVIDLEDSDKKNESLLKAKEYFGNALSIYPNSFNDNFDMARVCEMLQDYNCALHHYSQTLALDSQFTDATIALADIYYQVGSYGEAIVYFEEVRKLYPYDKLWLFKMSNMYYSLGEYHKAIAVNNDIISLDATIPESYLNKAYSFAKLNQMDSAKVNFIMGRSLAPYHTDVLNLVNLYPEIEN